MLGYADDEIEPHVSAWERLLHPDDVRARASRLNESVSARRVDLRRRVPPAAQGRPLRPRALARISGPPRTRRTGRPHRRHPLRSHRTEAGRGRAGAHRIPDAPGVRAGRRAAADRARNARSVRRAVDGARAADSGAQGRLRRPTPTCAAHVESIEAIAQRLDRDVDHLVWELRPTALDDLGLRAALANYVQDWSQRVGIAADAAHLRPARRSAARGRRNRALPHRAGGADQRRQARAGRERRVILERRADHVLLIIEDDGVGFDPAGAGSAGQGFGLLGMQERAALVGATLEIESAAGKGTTVLVRMARRRAGTTRVRSCLNAADAAPHPARRRSRDRASRPQAAHRQPARHEGVAEASDGDAAMQQRASR